MCSPPPPICILRGHEGVVTALYFTSEEDDGIIVKPSLISGSDIGEIIFWNLQTQRSYRKFKCHDGKMILYLFYYKSSLISQGREGLINVWRFIKDEWSITSSFKCAEYGFCSSTLFPTESTTYLVAPAGDESLNVYNYETENVLFHYEQKIIPAENAMHCGRDMCMSMKVFQKGAKLYLLLGYESGNITLWDYETKKEKSRLKCHPQVVFCLDFDSKYKNRGISGSADDVLKIWKITEDDQLADVHEITMTNPGVNTVKIRDDGKIVITAGQDYTIRVFSWKNLRPLAVLYFHTLPVVSLQCYIGPLSNYRSVFASGSKDKNICLWSIY